MSTEPDEEQALPTNAEDAKRLKAMKSMETTGAEDDNVPAAADVDQEALGKAMADLSGPKKMTSSTTTTVKVKQEDVALIVSGLVGNIRVRLKTDIAAFLG